MEPSNIWMISSILFLYIVVGIGLKTKKGKTLLPIHPEFTRFMSTTLIVVGGVGLCCVKILALYLYFWSK